jgi:hypothetical protein
MVVARAPHRSPDHRAAAARAPVGAVMLGLEHEYRVRSPDGEIVDFRRLIDSLPIDGRKLDPYDQYCRRCRWGGNITADDGEAEVAIPPVPLTRGFTRQVDRWAERAKAELIGVLPAGHQLEGWSTHISVSVPERINDDVSRLFARRFGADLLLLMGRDVSLGLLVHPRKGRIELGSEFVDGANLRAALAFSVGAVLACVVALENPGTQLWPPLIDARVRRAARRFGWWVGRASFGSDILQEGRSTVLPLMRGGTISAQDHLEAAWQIARAALHTAGLGADARAADPVVAGTRALPLDQASPEAIVVRAPLARRTRETAFGGLLVPRHRADLSVMAQLTTWDFTIFRIWRGAARSYRAVPRGELAAFLTDLDSGALDAELAATLERDGEGETSVLRGWEQAAKGGAFRILGPTIEFTPPERAPNGLPWLDPPPSDSGGGDSSGRRSGDSSGRRAGDGTSGHVTVRGVLRADGAAVGTAAPRGTTSARGRADMSTGRTQSDRWARPGKAAVPAVVEPLVDGGSTLGGGTTTGTSSRGGFPIWIIAIVGLLVVLVGGGVAFGIFGGSKPGATPTPPAIAVASPTPTSDPCIADPGICVSETPTPDPCLANPGVCVTETPPPSVDPCLADPGLCVSVTPSPSIDPCLADPGLCVSVTPSPSIDPCLADPGLCVVETVDDMLTSLGVNEKDLGALQPVEQIDPALDFVDPTGAAIAPPVADILGNATFEASVGQDFVHGLGACAPIALVCGTTPPAAGDFYVFVMQLGGPVVQLEGASYEIGLVYFDKTPLDGKRVETFDRGGFLQGTNTAYTLITPTPGFSPELRRFAHDKGEAFLHLEDTGAFVVVRNSVVAVFVPHVEWDGAVASRLYTFYPQNEPPATVHDTAPDLVDPLAKFDEASTVHVTIGTVVAPPPAVVIFAPFDIVGDKKVSSCEHVYDVEFQFTDGDGQSDIYAGQTATFQLLEGETPRTGVVGAGGKLAASVDEKFVKSSSGSSCHSILNPKVFTVDGKAVFH